MAPLILIAEDNSEIRALLRLYLEGEGLRVLEAEDGDEALAKARAQSPDLAILDVMMPGLSGYEVTRALRRFSEMPILILSAKSEDNDKILGLNLGADDYVTKPFNPQELCARVKSQLRRYTQLGDIHSRTRTGTLVNGRLAYDPESRQLTADGEPVRLTATETKIVELLMNHPGRVFPAEEIYRRVWGEETSYACENTVMVHIRRIREKVELNPKEPDYIKVVWGIGYKMERHG